jgi:CheY-like chemotaxis protein/two-component sensor histidine kinase
MEAIGQLAGGIAHDFNNLLTVITGRSQLLLRRIADDRARRDAQLIQMTAERAAALTKRLLAFSRKQTFHPVILDLGQLVEQLGPMLQRLLPEDIELVLRCHRELHTVRADPTQIEQVLLNLVVNAADAMPSGGCLLIETANVGRDEPGEPPPPGTAPAPSVRLSVTDTGTGMSEEIRSHLFEPFFTTKPPGKGTGLGLSTVYGIIQQHGGSISVQSTPGQGTTFTIDLPRADAERGVTVRRAPPESPAPGSETILLVEDEAEVRRLTREILEGSGYVVIEAGDPADALRLGQDTRRPIHLLLTDVVMPGMSGPELATRLTATRADLPVLFMSAYAPDAIRQRGMPGNGALIEKPFRPDALSRAVRSVLDGWTPAGAGPRSLVG